eukprot:m51a1_g7702 putative elav-like protein 2-like isoform x5 (564) ;mRNA; r:77387-80089
MEAQSVQQPEAAQVQAEPEHAPDAVCADPLAAEAAPVQAEPQEPQEPSDDSAAQQPAAAPQQTEQQEQQQEQQEQQQEEIKQEQQEEAQAQAPEAAEECKVDPETDMKLLEAQHELELEQQALQQQQEDQQQQQQQHEDQQQQQQQQQHEDMQVTQDNNANLIVNYLPPSINESGLYAMFSPFGTIEHIKLMVDKNTGSSLGYGFVKFSTHDSAERAIAVLNGKQLEKKVLKVSYSRPPSHDIRGANLYISGLEPSLTRTELEQIFSRYGRIIDSKILVDPVTGQSRGVAFVRYDKRPEAEEAIRALNGSSHPGVSVRTLVVKFAERSEGRRGSNQTAQTLQMQLQLQQQLGFGAVRTGYANAFGGMRYNPMMATAAAPAAPVMTGNPYIDQAALLGISPAAGMTAMPGMMGMGGMGAMGAMGGMGMGMTSMMGAMGGMVPGLANPAVSQPMMQQQQQQHGGSGGGFHGYCLFIYNLPSETDEAFVYRLFSPFGAVASVRVARDMSTGLCKGYGFANMFQLEDAQRAVLGLNGQVCAGKVLQVSFKTEKSAKQAARYAGYPMK